jgi:hypothetical protein
MSVSATCVAGERSMTERQELVEVSVTAWRKYDSCVRGAVLTLSASGRATGPLRRLTRWLSMTGPPRRAWTPKNWKRHERESD